MLDIADKSFYVYGAGQYAREFIFLVQLKKLEKNIKGVIVSTKAAGDENFLGYPLYGYDEIKDKLEGSVVYVAISSERAGNLEDKIKAAGAAEVISFTAELYQEMQRDIFAAFMEQSILDDQVVVWSYWGLGYSDQCKYIAMELHKRAPKLKIIWAVSGQTEGFPDWITPVTLGTPQYYEAMGRSRVLVSNVNAPVDRSFKRNEQYYIYTWHGIGPSKRIEWQSPIHKGRDGYDEAIVKDRWNAADIMVAGSDFCHEVYRNSFLYDGVIEDWGYPRNDVFFHDNDYRKRVCDFYGIDNDKKIILYAPTFRNELMESGDVERLKEIYDIDLQRVEDAFENRFGQEYVVLYRFHHYVHRYMDISSYRQMGLDATFYPDMQHLIVASDVLITDYSSSMWDFSLTRKPVFLYYHDAEEYEEKYQGFYVFPDNYPYPKGHTTDELCEAIALFDEADYQKKLNKWFEKYGTYDDGHASERIADRILDVIRNPAKYGK